MIFETQLVLVEMLKPHLLFILQEEPPTEFSSIISPRTSFPLDIDTPRFPLKSDFESNIYKRNLHT